MIVYIFQKSKKKNHLTVINNKNNYFQLINVMDILYTYNSEEKK